MATLKKFDLSGKETAEIALEDEYLDVTVSAQSIKDYLVAIRKNARQWSAKTQGRSEVNKSKKKPHQQKGLGRARQGFLGAPQYKGGGVVFGPRPKFDQHTRINRKEKRAAIKFLIAELIKQGKVSVLEKFESDAPKTKPAANFFQKMDLIDKRVLVIGSGLEEDKSSSEIFFKSLSNIPRKNYLRSTQLNGYELALAGNLVILAPALDAVMALLGKDK